MPLRPRGQARSGPGRSTVQARDSVEVVRAPAHWLGSPATSTRRPFREELNQRYDRIDVRCHRESLNSGVGTPALELLSTFEHGLRVQLLDAGRARIDHSRFYPPRRPRGRSIRPREASSRIGDAAGDRVVASGLRAATTGSWVTKT